MCKTTSRKNNGNPAKKNPAGPKPAALPKIKTLQQYLTAAYNTEKANIEPSTMTIDGFALKTKNLAITIIAIDKTGDHYAGINDIDMYYSGSLVKVAGLYAAHDLRARARLHAGTQSFSDDASFRTSLASVVNPTGAIEKLRLMSVGLQPSLKDMFVGHTQTGPQRVEFTQTYQGHLNNVLHNSGARGIIRPLGYCFINVSLMDSKFFDPDPAKLNGIWLAGDYSGDLPKPQRLAVERVPVVNDTVPGGGAQAMTTKKMSEMFRKVHSKGGFPNIKDQTERDAANDDMHTILKNQASFFNDASTFTVPIKFTDHCAKVGIGNLGPVDTPGPKVDSEGAVMTWKPDAADPDQVANFNDAHKREATGRFVLVWQGMYELSGRFDALARLVNKTMDDFWNQA